MSQQHEEQNKKQKFNHWQYKFLKLCSEKGDEGVKKWNNWRKRHPDKEILLEGANLSKAYLRKVNLSKAFLMYSILEMANCRFTNFERAILLKANMAGIQLYAAKLNNAKLGQDMEAVEFSFHGISSLATNIKGYDLGANLNKAILWYADLKGTNLSHALLEKTDFKWALLDGSTTLRKCVIDEFTDFRETSLNSAIIDNARKQLLEKNIRRMNWEEWYKEHSCLKWLVKPFWWISDYGISTIRIILTFLILVSFFAAIYLLFAYISPPGIVSNLSVIENTNQIVTGWLLLVRAVYFSVVTMTTLGFGDMYANPQSIFGHILLTFQVILGYVLLGALVTRFAVLFTAGGPAGKFEDEKKENKKK